MFGVYPAQAFVNADSRTVVDTPPQASRTSIYQLAGFVGRKIAKSPTVGRSLPKCPIVRTETSWILPMVGNYVRVGSDLFCCR